MPDVRSQCTWPGCDYAGSQAAHLAAHLRTHSGERPYGCPVAGCDYACARSWHITRHMERQHPGEPRLAAPLLVSQVRQPHISPALCSVHQASAAVSRSSPQKFHALHVTQKNNPQRLSVAQKRDLGMNNPPSLEWVPPPPPNEMDERGVTSPAEAAASPAGPPQDKPEPPPPLPGAAFMTTSLN